MKRSIFTGITTFLLLLVVLFLGMIIGREFESEEKIEETVEETKKESYEPVLDHEKAIIDVVEENTSSVVSIVSSQYIEFETSLFDDFFFFPEREPETEERLETGKGTGFIISEDGLILTNRHLVRDKDADYAVITSDKEEFEAEVLAIDPVQDLAVIKIDGEDFNPATIGDSDTVRPGQTAIAIGNALGEFKDTVSVGVISGMERSIVARGGRKAEVLHDLIQTDAAINFGNSGGPLLNLKGEVVGINTATAVHAEGIGFAIPINSAKRAIEGVKEEEEITYPFLGVRYLMIERELEKEKDLPVSEGALIVDGDRGGPAIEPGSAAEEAGLKEGDIILEFNEEKVTQRNPLAKIIVQYHPGDTVTLKIIREGEVMELDATLGKM